MHDEKWGPIHFGKGKCRRFDDPDGKYGVMYCGATYYASFTESVGQEIPPPASVSAGMLDESIVITEDQLAAYHLCRLNVSRPLRLVDLTGPFLKHFRADAQVTIGTDYRDSQRLSQAIHSHPDKVDGIYYTAKTDPQQASFALFDRCKKAVRIEKKMGSLLERANRHILARIVSRYRITIIPGTSP